MMWFGSIDWSFTKPSCQAIAKRWEAFLTSSESRPRTFSPSRKGLMWPCEAREAVSSGEARLWAYSRICYRLSHVPPILVAPCWVTYFEIPQKYPFSSKRPRKIRRYFLSSWIFRVCARSGGRHRNLNLTWGPPCCCTCQPCEICSVLHTSTRISARKTNYQTPFPGTPLWSSPKICIPSNLCRKRLNS